MQHDSLSTVYSATSSMIEATDEPRVKAARRRLDAITHVPDELYIPTLPTGEVDPAVAHWALEPRAASTRKSYAHDIRQFFDYWYANYENRHWTTARNSELRDFIGWFRYQSPKKVPSENDEGRSPATVHRIIATLHSLYESAIAIDLIIHNPTPHGPLNATKGRKRQAVNWLTPRAVQDWQTYGINRLTDPNADRMLQNIRNNAFTELLYGTGLRRTEAGGLLTIELPQNRFSSQLYHGWVPGTLAKNSPYRGRSYYADLRAVSAVENYCLQQRELDISLAIKSNRYLNDRKREIIVDARQIGTPNAVITLEDISGNQRVIRLSDLKLEERLHVYELGEDLNLRPSYLWLRSDGRPLLPTAWNGIFNAANRACARALGPTAPWITPHRLRHSFALRVFAASLAATVHAPGTNISTATDALINQGNIWLRLQNLLGHKSMDTTRDHYLEPVATLEWELVLRNMDHGTVDKLLAVIAQMDPRVKDRDTSNAD